MVESEKTPVTLGLVLAEDKFRTFFETKVELTPRAAFGAWEEAPRIRISRLVREAGDGAYKVIAEAVDDKGLTTVWCTVGNKKIDYIDAHDEPKRKLHVDLPWHPSADVQRVEIIAKDSDGMTTTYVTDPLNGQRAQCPPICGGVSALSGGAPFMTSKLASA
jgi:hypothetical protein